MFAFTPPWNDFIVENCLGPDDEKVRPPPPGNAHADSLKTTANFPEEVEKRAKAKAKREARAAKKNKIEQKNIELTQQDVQDKRNGPLPERQGIQFPLEPPERNQLPINPRRQLLPRLMSPPRRCSR